MIVCCGEALIDMLPRTTTGNEPAFVPFPGGALFNSAIALGRLGVPVEFFSGLSTDLFGRQLGATLAESGVGTRFVRFSARPTTLAFVRLDAGQARYEFHDEGTAGRMLTEHDLPDFGDGVQAMLFGAISLVQEPCGTAYETLMRREHGRRVTMLDPNIRPDFIPDGPTHYARMRRMIAMADIVKFSHEDLAWFAGSDSPEAAVAEALRMGPKLVVVTRGGEGAIAYTRNAAVAVKAPKVRVVDTVGAGDTFNAGLLAALFDIGALDRKSIARLPEAAIRGALELACRTAAIAVSRAGANPPWRNELL